MRGSVLWYTACFPERFGCFFILLLGKIIYRLTLDTCAFQEDYPWPTLPENIEVLLQKRMGRHGLSLRRRMPHCTLGLPLALPADGIKALEPNLRLTMTIEGSLNITIE